MNFLAPTGAATTMGRSRGLYNMLDSASNSNGLIMRFPSQLFVLICVLFALASCGKKGDLYLPDATPKPQQTQSAK